MAVGEHESYVIVNHVIEFSVRGGKWMTWPDAGRQDALSALGDEDAILKAFRKVLRTKHDPEHGLRYRLVHRFAVITDIVMAEEMPDGRVAVPKDKEFTTPHAIHGEETAPCGHPGRDGFCDERDCWGRRTPPP